ncbi:MAG: hypothetical protein JWQ85_2780 [Mucilaginibacter sp.]|nr:hypothetical protein [Mucilaginibacter sp.]
MKNALISQFYYLRLHNAMLIYLCNQKVFPYVIQTDEVTNGSFLIPF